MKVCGVWLKSSKCQHTFIFLKPLIAAAIYLQHISAGRQLAMSIHLKIFWCHLKIFWWHLKIFRWHLKKFWWHLKIFCFDTTSTFHSSPSRNSRGGKLLLTQISWAMFVQKIWKGKLWSSGIFCANLLVMHLVVNFVTSHLVVKFGINTSGDIWWPNLSLIQVVPSGDLVCNQCKWCHLVVKYGTNASCAIWWPIWN